VPYCHSGEHKIYGNLIAGVSRAVQIGSANKSCGQKNIEIYNNTVVDPESYGIKLYDPNSNWSGNQFKKNIVWLPSSGSAYSSHNSPTGFNFDSNNFYGKGSPSGNLANGAIVENPDLSKTSGWRNIEPGAAKLEWFLPENSLVIQNSIGALSSLTGTSGQQYFVANDDSPKPPPPSKLKIVE
jgi:hypothetical protein